MYSESDIASAVRAGAIPAHAAEALRSFKQTRDASSLPDEENVRLITSFNDIFVTIAGILLFVGLGALGGDLIGPLLIALAAWGLSEYFIRRRRMALPSIVLLIAFVGAVGAAAGAAGLDIFAALLAVGAAWLHWWRFRVPITVAAGVMAGIVFATGLLEKVLGDDNILMVFLLLCGIGTFIYAMYWDAADTARRTAKADIAFWLHVLAALLIVHPVFQLLDLGETKSLGGGLTVLGIYLVLSVIALAVDRRALMASALAYVLGALVQLISQGGNSEVGMALAALVIGSALLLLSALWLQARRAVVGVLPQAWAAQIPPIS